MIADHAHKMLKYQEKNVKSFRITGIAVIIFAAFSSISHAQQADTEAAAATKKLGAFLGKWTTVGTFANGEKATTELECRWSAQGYFLVCEQHVKLAHREQQQLTVYSYNPNDHTYQYATFSDPGMGGKPRSSRSSHLKTEARHGNRSWMDRRTRSPIDPCKLQEHPCSRKFKAWLERFPGEKYPAMERWPKQQASPERPGR
jgi:hypothetical protein